MKTFVMKKKYVTQTCVFDLTTRTIMPKRVALSEMMTGHLSLEGFSSPVYVKSFDMGSGSLILLCRQGMYEELLRLVGSVCSFHFLNSEPISYSMCAVSLHDLCFIELSLIPISEQ